MCTYIEALIGQDRKKQLVSITDDYYTLLDISCVNMNNEVFIKIRVNGEAYLVMINFVASTALCYKVVHLNFNFV